MSLQRNHRHHDIVLPLEAGRMSVLRRLVTSGVFDGYVTYSKGDELVFAGGCVADVRVEHDQVTRIVNRQRTSEPLGDQPFRQVAGMVESLPFDRWRMYGYISFETALVNFGIPMRQPMDTSLVHLVVPETEVTISHAGVRISSVSEAALRETSDLITDHDGGSYLSEGFELVDHDRADYMGKVADAIDAIRGDRMQKVILSRTVPVPFRVDLVETYALGAEWNTPVRSFLLDMDGRRAVGFSPETVLEVRGDGWLRTQPLAGTRASGQNPQEEARLRQELLGDAKEVYEHAISAKLAYEEMLAVAAADTVGVRNFMTVKRRGPVQHLASEVTGYLASGMDRWDAIEALFPAVTASGIPKREAITHIAATEADPRGLYAGAVCALSSDGQLDAALVLRAIYEEQGRAWLQAGAGIVEWSDPFAEYQETKHKLESVARVLVRADSRRPNNCPQHGPDRVVTPA